MPTDQTRPDLRELVKKWRRKADELFDWAVREMADPHGGSAVAASQDQCRAEAFDAAADELEAALSAVPVAVPHEEKHFDVMTHTCGWGPHPDSCYACEQEAENQRNARVLVPASDPPLAGKPCPLCGITPPTIVHPRLADPPPVPADPPMLPPCGCGNPEMCLEPSPGVTCAAGLVPTPEPADPPKEDRAIAALRLLVCPQCVDEHVQNTQSVSCYCDCHSSTRDEANWQTSRDEVLAALLASSRATAPPEKPDA